MENLFNSPNPMGGFTMITPRCGKDCKGLLPENILTYHIEDGRLSINSEFSKVLKRDGFRQVGLAYNELTGEAALVFSKVKISGGYPLFKGKERNHSRINSKALLRVLNEKLGPLPDKGFFEMKPNLSRKSDYIFRVITPKEEI